jgi:RNA polymerase sigma-70 factor (ECF subfamily)
MEQTSWESGQDRTVTEPAATGTDRNEVLVQLLTAHQGRLFSFIYALLPDPDRARDVLQETNLLVWRKSHEFAEGTNFWAWASKIAHFKVLSHCRGIQRDRHVFDEALVNDLASTATARGAEEDLRGPALRRCLGKLRPQQLSLLQSRYTAGISLSTLAEQLGQSADAVGMRLHRIRQILLKCIERALAEERV